MGLPVLEPVSGGHGGGGAIYSDLMSDMWVVFSFDVRRVGGILI